MISYSYPISSENGVIYSCDMVRLSFSIPKCRFPLMRDIFDKMQFSKDWDFVADYYGSTSLQIGRYRDIFACCKDSYHFTVGMGLVTAETSSNQKCFIEFNPNKCDMRFIKSLMKFFAGFMSGKYKDKFYELVRWDLAIDIPCERDKCYFVKKGKREYSKRISKSVTEYVGKRNTNGFAKLYDKTVEAGLEYPLTRLEITCDSLTTFALPEAYVIHHDMYTDEGLNATDRVIVKLLRQQDSDTQIQLLKEMGRNKANKLKQYIFPLECRFKYDMNAISWVAMEIERMEYLWSEEVIDFDFDSLKDIKGDDINDEIFKQFTLFDE